MCYNMITILEVDYENPWYYKGTAFTSDDIGDFFGYVYLITNNENGRPVSYTHLTLPTNREV